MKNSEIEVLVVTTKQTDYQLLDRMNIQTNAIVGNQTDKTSKTVIDFKDNKIEWYNFEDRGVGLNRNNILMRSKADVCVLADDDMVFYDGYAEVVKKVFAENKKADVIIFNIDESNPTRYKNVKVKKINKRNYGRYGAARISFRRESVFLNGIAFNLLFGGGTQYSCGEDTLFLKECLDKKLKIYAVPISIAMLTDDGRDSTWFDGYNDKFFYDKGVLYYFLNRRFCVLLSLYHCIRHRKLYKIYGVNNAYRQMKKGIKDIRKKLKK